MVASRGNISEAGNIALPKRLPTEGEGTMSTTAVGRCPQCEAVVNVNWPSCLVCHALLSPMPVSQCHAFVPGARITWETANGTQRNGVIDFLHVYPGEVWAFCTRPDGGWCAVNAKHCTKSEPS